MIKTAFEALRPMQALFLAALVWLAAGVSAPLGAQGVESFDPDEAYAQPSQGSASQSPRGGIDADLDNPAQADLPPLPPLPPLPSQTRQPEPATDRGPEPAGQGETYGRQFDRNENARDAEQARAGKAWVDPASGASVGQTVRNGEEQVAEAVPAANDPGTYGEDDLIGAAESVFGKGAEGVARMIEDLLKKEGKPNGYIVGREAGGAFIIGARYGSGTLHHKVEGKQKVYWTGPSIGFDAGANAANTFVLVYNLFDSEDLFERFPAGEGQAYLIGGLHASYMRRGDVVLIPIRMGAGVRLGINAGYMKFSKKQRWLPF